KADGSGYGEGKNFLGSTLVETDSNGSATFNTGLTTGAAAGECVSATATSPSGDTSEFGLDIFTQGPINLLVTGTGTPDPVLAGGQETYTLTVANQGNIAAHSVTLLDQLPSGVTVASNTTTQGFIFPSANGSGVQAIIGTLAPGATVTVTIVINIPAS